VIERRRRLSDDPTREVAPADTAYGRSFPSGRQLAWALVLAGLASALVSLFAIVALAGAMANAGPPQGPMDFLPVFIGTLVGVAGDLLMVRGGAGVVRPGAWYSGGRTSALVGILLQVPAAAAVGELEASVVITALYLLLLCGLATLAVMALPGPAARPAARHPEPPTPAAPASRPARAESAQPIQWVAAGAPPPPSAGRGADMGSAWERSQPRDQS
jgi:hypothetical protein